MRTRRGIQRVCSTWVENPTSTGGRHAQHRNDCTGGATQTKNFWPTPNGRCSAPVVKTGLHLASFRRELAQIKRGRGRDARVLAKWIDLGENDGIPGGFLHRRATPIGAKWAGMADIAKGHPLLGKLIRKKRLRTRREGGYVLTSSDQGEKYTQARTSMH